MTSNLDTYRAVHVVIQHHGAHARAHADRRAAELVQAGDAARHEVWRRFGVAIDELYRAAPGAGERVQ